MLKRAGFLCLLLACVSIHAQSHRRAVTPALPSDDITILQTTDLHDKANGSGHNGFDVDPVTAMSTTGAYARIAAYVNGVRTSAGHPVIVVDSGDWMMGTLYDLTAASGPIALYFVKSLNYDAITLGNHEFDYTAAGLAGMITAASSSFGFQTPIVASNMDPGSSALAGMFGDGKPIRKTYVKTLSNGMKVGFIGLMGEEATVEAPGAPPVTFQILSFNYTAIQALVDDMRNNQGVQIVIALSHSGTDASGNAGEDVELARHVHGINVIASGHTHTPLATAHDVPNGNWTTQIIDAGAFGSNVARLDLRVNRTAGTTTRRAFTNAAMTSATTTADALIAGLVNMTDQGLNRTLAPVFTQFFTDYDPNNLAKGVYHVVATATQDLISNDHNPVVSPNGLGNLCADSVRNVPNSIIAQTLAAAGGNPMAVPGFDFTPVQIGVVATGVLRSNLQGGVPLTFADIYNVLPLGISPDQSQTLPIGYPLISAYAEPADVRKICALQLVGQSNLVSSSFYLNMSGLKYGLKSAETYTYFKYATAAGVLQITGTKASAGSTAAAQAFAAVFANDHGASMISLASAGNPYASAIVKLNDVNPDAAQVQTNITTFGEIEGTAVFGTAAVSALVLQKAVNAIDTLSGFAVSDINNSGTTTDLPPTGRVRVSVDLYALLLINAVESQYGLKITAYQAATGNTTLSSADFPTLLGNRFDLAPSTPGIQELKEWMALLSNVSGALHSTIGPDYASTANFTDFPTDGIAVRARNASYPLPQIGQLATTLATVQAAP